MHDQYIRRLPRSHTQCHIVQRCVYERLLQGPAKLVQFILRLILEKPDLIVENVNIQNVSPDPVSKETRMDITATDGAGKLYDIEFQTVLEKDLIERQRYYHSQIDHDMLKKGDEYAKLPETYVLFICRGDAAGNKKPIDQFENKNEDGIRSSSMPIMRAIGV